MGRQRRETRRPGRSRASRRGAPLRARWGAVVPFAYAMSARLARGQAAVYVAVASVVGVDALMVILGAAAIWPVGIPVLLTLLAVVYLWRRGFGRLRRPAPPARARQPRNRRPLHLNR